MSTLLVRASTWPKGARSSCGIESDFPSKFRQGEWQLVADFVEKLGAWIGCNSNETSFAGVSPA
jgi:hypothetical protein